MELWAGIECSITRIGDEYRDQVAETIGLLQPRHIDAIASLNVSAFRYPLLWESMAQRGDAWAPHDQCLQRLRDLGITPIVGLVHHGSGPRGTGLHMPNFAPALAEFAGRVAERYPWVEAFTPVNEPLTTARFSALYGFWYPHLTDHAAFLRALVNQCRAVALSMEAIRQINPRARLIQTEDMGKVFATRPLQYQADYENERRWLSLDLLCGRVDRRHPLYRALIDAGVGERDIGYFRDAGAAPDIIGVNHYLTSERFLDHRLTDYAPDLWGGNGRDRYVDTEARRADLPHRSLGPAARLTEAWERYGIPIAVTECHNGAPPDEQIRWLHEMWQGARDAVATGADIRALAVWAVFGAVDWNSLQTKRAGYREAGVFRIEGDVPVLTEYGRVVQELGASGDVSHPALQERGWWRRPDRLRARPEPVAVAS